MSKAEASATPPTPAEDVKAVTATLDVAGERLILLGALAALPAVAAIVPDLIQLRDNGLLATYLLGTLLLLGNAAARGRFSIRARIALLILTQVAAAVAIVSQLGLQSPPSILGPIATLLTTVYFGVGRGAALALAFNVFFLMVGLLT